MGFAAGIDTDRNPFVEPDAASPATMGGNAIPGFGHAQFDQQYASAPILDFAFSGVMRVDAAGFSGSSIGRRLDWLGLGACAGCDYYFAGSFAEHGNASVRRDAARTGVEIDFAGGQPI